MGKYLTLNDLNAYKIAFNLSNYIWNIVIKWSYFEKSTVGMQLVDACDSISANIAEDFGRYSKKDKVKIYRICLGSLSEVLDWVQKSITRQLITEEQLIHIKAESDKLPKEIYSLIIFTNEKLKI